MQESPPMLLVGIFCVRKYKKALKNEFKGFFVYSKSTCVYLVVGVEGFEPPTLCL